MSDQNTTKNAAPGGTGEAAGSTFERQHRRITMNRRTPLIIPMAAFELLCLALAVVVVLCHPPTGERFSEWMIRHLPGPEFYGFKWKNIP